MDTPVREPGTEEGDLFGRTGMGPIEGAEFWEPREYTGPLYPAPFNTPGVRLDAPSVSLCNDARRQWSTGHFTDAKKSYESARKLSPGNPDFPFEEAQLAWSLRDGPEAKNLLHESIRLCPKNNDKARIGLTVIHLSDRELTEAYEEFGKIEWQSPPTVRYVASLLRKYAA